MVVINILSESRSGAPSCKDTLCWNEEMKTVNKIKRAFTKN